MLMSLPELVVEHGLQIDGVLHLGAHLAEEAVVYQAMGISNVTWVEANPNVLGKLRQKLIRYPTHRLIHALVYSEDDQILELKITNYDGMSSSIFEFGTHPEFSPDTVFVERADLRTRTVDSLVAEYGITANFLNMDLQGAELHALRGGEQFVIEQVTAIMCEVNQADVYVGLDKVDALDAWLGDRGFDRVATHWVTDQGWGDALYCRSRS